MAFIQLIRILRVLYPAGLINIQRGALCRKVSPLPPDGGIVGITAFLIIKRGDFSCRTAAKIPFFLLNALTVILSFQTFINSTMCDDKNKGLRQRLKGLRKPTDPSLRSG